MTRNLKVLGLALIAVFALGAIAAQAAMAEGEQFHSDGESTILTGANVAGTEDTFATKNGEGAVVTCKQAVFQSTVSGATTSSITVHPTYGSAEKPSGCTASGVEAHVRTNMCDYTFSSETSEGVAPVTINCEAGNKIEVDATGICTLTIGGQEPSGGVVYSEKGETASDTIKVTANVTGIEYTRSNATGNQFFCGAIEGSGKDGVYESTDSVTCYKDVGSPQSDPTTPNQTVTGEDEAGSTECWWQ